MVLQQPPNPFMAILAAILLVAYLGLDLYFDITRYEPTLTHLVRGWAQDFRPWPQVAFLVAAVVLWIHFFIVKG